mgnify:CR=1 FL=1
MSRPDGPRGAWDFSSDSTLLRRLAANAQADASTGCVSAKNIVATAIRNLILDFRGVHPEIENIVLVGNDAVIPFFRQPDQGLLANENNYVPPVLTTSASEASLKLGYYLTQDHYAAACQVALKVGTVPLPDLGIGRLVETPAEIANVLAAYESAGGMALVDARRVTVRPRPAPHVCRARRAAVAALQRALRRIRLPADRRLRRRGPTGRRHAASRPPPHGA